MNLRIPLARPDITDADREAVWEALRTPYLSMGAKLQEFEQAMCRYLGASFAVAVNSGTSALHVALRVLDIPPGSEVILPSFAFIAPLNVLLQERLTPVFVDIDPATLNTTPQAVEAAITPRTKAILAIHTFGRPVAAHELRKIADKHGLFLIEDVCEALGAEIGGKKAGTHGDVGVLAFYPNKQITTGEGGMLLTNQRALAERASRLRNQARNPSLGWYQHAEVGFSYRLSEMNCALGLSQLSRLEAFLQRRQVLAALYDRSLASVDGVVRPSLSVPEGKISWFSYVIRLDAEFADAGRDYVSDRLAHQGIVTGKYFAPLHRQPLMREFVSPPHLPHTDYAAARVLALPFFTQLMETGVEEVCGALKAALSELRARKT
jgi:perosamine synthetase